MRPPNPPLVSSTPRFYLSGRSTVPFSFKDAVEFNGNEAEYGGGLAVEGGKVT